MQMLLHDVHVLVAAPREVDDDMPSCGKLAVVPEYPRQCYLWAKECRSCETLYQLRL